MRAPKGLEGVIVDSTAISVSDPEGYIIYRGYDLSELAEKSSFEETAYLILNGRLPSSTELKEFRLSLAKNRDVPPMVMRTISQLPKRSPMMDVLRIGVSLLGSFDRERDLQNTESNMRKAIKLVSRTATLVANGFRVVHGGQRPVKPNAKLDHSSNFLYVLKNKTASQLHVRSFEQTLILYMDHDFNASTFATRVVGSTLADAYSAASAGLAALKGPLHGGANEKAMEMLRNFKSVEEARDWVKQTLGRKERIMGFGHRVYRKIDPRVPVAKNILRRLSEENSQTAKLLDICLAVEEVMWSEKQIPPNIDFYAAPIYYSLGIPIPTYTPIFALTRMVGWSAHFIEQVETNKLIRPNAEYVGQRGLKYVPIEMRN